MSNLYTKTCSNIYSIVICNYFFGSLFVVIKIYNDIPEIIELNSKSKRKILELH
jgi:hypothetical protein